MASEEFSTATTPSEIAFPLYYPTSFEVVASFIYYGLLWLIIFVGNVLVIFSYLHNRRLQTVTNLFVVNLAINDLMAGFISVPFWLYSYSCQYYKTIIHPAAYEFYITLDVFIGCASIMLLTAISLERCMAVVTPMKHRAMTVGKFQNMILTAWAFAVLVAGMYPIQLKHWQKEYTTFIFLTCFMGPLGAIVSVYILIYKTAVRSKNRVYPLGLSVTLLREIRMATTIAVVTGIFIAAWMPFFIVTLIATYDVQSLPEPPTLFRLTAFVKALHYSNSAVNPFVYGYRSLEMRRKMNQLLAKLFCIKLQNQSSFLDSRKRSDKNAGNKGNTRSTTQLPCLLMVTALEQGGKNASLTTEIHRAVSPTCSSRLSRENSLMDETLSCPSSRSSSLKSSCRQLSPADATEDNSFKENACVSFTSSDNLYSRDSPKPVYV